jgi:hypothetical protein
MVGRVIIETADNREPQGVVATDHQGLTALRVPGTRGYQKPGKGLGRVWGNEPD